MAFVTLDDIETLWRRLLSQFNTPDSRKAVAGEALTRIGSVHGQIAEAADGARVEALGFGFLGEVARSVPSRTPKEELALLIGSAHLLSGPGSFETEMTRTGAVFERERIKPVMMAFLAGASANDGDQLEAYIRVARAGYDSISDETRKASLASRERPS